jgi:hypothetical protein
MVCARIAAMVFALCACTALAQQHAEGTLAVDVTDTTGARIPGALIEVTAEGSGSRSVAATDATGEAVFHLDQGIYGLKVQARWFKTREEKQIEVKAGTYIALKLLAQCGSESICDDVEILADAISPSLESSQLTEQIPLAPMQQLVLPARPLRRRPHWF